MLCVLFVTHAARLKRFAYAKEFMMPEWMVDIPQDLCTQV